MKKYILLPLMATLLLTCKSETAEESGAKTTEIENLTPGPIVHESLNDEQLIKIKFIQTTFAEVYPVSLEETIMNFKRDQNPDKEIDIWLNMAEVYEPFATKHAAFDQFKLREEAFKLILLRSMMPEQEAIKSAELKALTLSQAQEILSGYTTKAKPIEVE